MEVIGLSQASPGSRILHGKKHKNPSTDRERKRSLRQLPHGVVAIDGSESGKTHSSITEQSPPSADCSSSSALKPLSPSATAPPQLSLHHLQHCRTTKNHHAVFFKELRSHRRLISAAVVCVLVWPETSSIGSSSSIMINHGSTSWS
ncbi:hypothetical protein PIB30_001646 [Stylosanthes scabra]|uniref:Uncharacterized protein n=1 Tax=Stylosanthes scabra TaxID=79078 RepID=A0ABU6T2H4_9FABA|nr:hypothetical protein [Stylosanthes scabra]